MSDLIKCECVCAKCINRKECSKSELWQQNYFDENEWTCANAKLDHCAPISIFDFIGEVEDEI